VNKQRKVIGVMQTLNKKTIFTDEDERRLRAFTAQIAITLENAKLFDDVTKMKFYNDSMPESMSNGLITLDENGIVVTCNSAGSRILKVAPRPSSQGRRRGDRPNNPWILDRIRVSIRKRPPTCRWMSSSSSIGRRVGQPHRLRSDTDSMKSLGTMLVFGTSATEARQGDDGTLHGPDDRPRMLDNEPRASLGGVSASATPVLRLRGFTRDREAGRAGHRCLPQRILHPDGRLHRRREG